MSKLLLNLRNVPADEADDVRQWLARENIAFYETAPSPWGISSGAIWIREDADAARAKLLMADYQAQRRQRAHTERQASIEDGSAETFAGLFSRRPGHVLAVLLAIIAIVALTLALPYLILR